MCGLFGFLHYGQDSIKNLKGLTNMLACESDVRGTYAAGIAFNSKDICILKEAKSAYQIQFKHSDNIKALTGHTRHSTQGSKKKNYNNHPFLGICKNAKFALAHNGVLLNDNELRRKYNLPSTHIETDSYIAVQLLEHKKVLNAESIKFMAESVEGSYSFSILDDKNNIWLVKGDSPIEILRFPEYKLYVYASTEEILWRALIETNLFSEIKAGRYEKIDIAEGEILKITPKGDLQQYPFEYTDYTPLGKCVRWDYGMYYDTSDYIDDLKSVAAYQGYSPEDIDSLLDNGFAPEEIEEYIYCMGEV